DGQRGSGDQRVALERGDAGGGGDQAEPEGAVLGALVGVFARERAAAAGGQREGDRGESPERGGCATPAQAARRWSGFHAVNLQFGPCGCRAISAMSAMKKMTPAAVSGRTVRSPISRTATTNAPKIGPPMLPGR